MTKVKVNGRRGDRFSRNGLFCDFYFWVARYFPPILSPDSYSIFVGKSAQKILQETPQQNPLRFAQQESLTLFCKGATPKEEETKDGLDPSIAQVYLFWLLFLVES